MIILSSFKNITLEEVKSIVFQNTKIEIEEQSLQHVERSFNFLSSFIQNKVVYGINTGFGPMAQYLVKSDEQKALQYNLIRSHAAGAGKKLDDISVRSAMLVRLCSLLKGYSGIHTTAVLLLKDMMNKEMYPYIPVHGGVGASGDLVQLSHIALAMIGEGLVSYNGQVRPTHEVFSEVGLKAIEINIREGLSLINGTSVMTGIASVNLIMSKQLLEHTVCASALINEIVSSFDDYFSPALNGVKLHKGQQKIAEKLFSILQSSRLISKREEHFNDYTSNLSEDKIVFNRRVQEHYSLRCLPQILGPIEDTVRVAAEIVENEINSVSDNPIIDHQKGDIYHGGNFHGDYVSLEMDKLKISVAKLSMLSERHLAFLCNPKLNELLPPFVNLGKLGLNLGVQGLQFTATSTVAENQMLSNSMYVHSIPTNNDNQDMVSMGTNAALITQQVIENAYQVLSIEMIALAQAVDYLDIEDKLADSTKKLYKKIREIVPLFVEDTPKYIDVENLKNFLQQTN